jgi:Ca2+-binding RTX toxin-like protein
VVVLAMVGVLLGAGASSALAATVTGTAADPVFNADAGLANTLTVTEAAVDTMTFSDPADPIVSAPAGCTLGTPLTGDATCIAPGGSVDSVTTNLGDLPDFTTLAGVTAATIQNGGDSDDVLGDGAGDDTLDGGAGNDFLISTAGTDDLRGGTGFDAAAFFDSADIAITLDDLANDGAAGALSNVRSDIEDIFSNGSGNDTMVGSSGFNMVGGGTGNDSVDGGAGNDVLTGEDGDDTMRARDGFADRVDCGAGSDTAIVDTLDTVSSNCETVDRVDAGNANDVPEDAPPTVAFASPAEGATLPGAPSVVKITAGDDKGVSQVILLDDGKTVGSDTTAPYEITYSPTADDVGRNTLVAIAVDGSQQATSAVRAVNVGRFAPASVSETVSPARDRTRPFRFTVAGTIRMPAGVTKAQGCGSGTVTVTGKRGSRTVYTRASRIRKDCTFSVTTRISARGRLKFTSRFAGNDVLSAKTSSVRDARAG